MSEVRSITIQVTQRHIDEAIPRDSEKCMISEAIKELLPDATDVWVDEQAIHWVEPDGREVKEFTPDPVRERLLLWDLGEKPFPFYFLLEYSPKGAKRSTLQNANLKTSAPSDPSPVEHSQTRDTRSVKTRKRRPSGEYKNTRSNRQALIIDRLLQDGPREIVRDANGRPIVGQQQRVRLFGQRSFLY